MAISRFDFEIAGHGAEGRARWLPEVGGMCGGKQSRATWPVRCLGEVCGRRSGRKVGEPEAL